MDIYQHFRKDEHPFIDQVLSWIEQVERSFQPKLTDFLDPREQQVIKMLIGKNNPDIQLKLSGGTVHSERKRAIIAPYYEEIDDDMFDIVCLEANYPTKFINLSHPDVMGTFLSLGLRRNKLGDIYVRDGLLQFMATNDIVSYVQSNLTMIKNVRISLNTIPLSNVAFIPEAWQESSHTVSSLRLDTIIKEIYNLSRKDAGANIAKGYVKLNYKVADDVKTILEEGDLISLRGKGRSKLIGINGQSKKGKWKITAGILK